jgi:hypothetical protein
MVEVEIGWLREMEMPGPVMERERDEDDESLRAEGEDSSMK